MGPLGAKTSQWRRPSSGAQGHVPYLSYPRYATGLTKFRQFRWSDDQWI